MSFRTEEIRIKFGPVLSVSDLFSVRPTILSCGFMIEPA